MPSSATSNERIRVLFADHLNVARGKYLPPSFAANGSARACLGVYALTYDRDLIPAPGGGLLTGLPDMEMIFDPDDLRPSWHDNTKILLADLEFEGRTLPLCGRSLLKRAVQAWRDEGLEAMVGVEYEANLLQQDQDGNWVPYHTPGGYVYGTGPCADPGRVLETIWDRVNAVGLPIESMNSEFDPGQFEMTLHYRDALNAIDDAFLLRLLAREVAAEMGLLLSFMPKPHEAMGGSGFHINFSLNNKDGQNALVDPGAEDGLADITKKAIAGLMRHHEGLAGLLAPLSNSYRRLAPASMSGYWANWGYDHRGVTVRLPAERNKATRIEHRMADCGANPYTATAAVLLAAKMGLDNSYELQPAETGDCFENTDAKGHCAESLDGAIKALAADVALKEVLGSELVDHFVAIKEAEVEKTNGLDLPQEFAYYGHYI
ncbi:MAG: glutamine synthetase family protein [Pseudomonadota bacterium]